MGNKSEPNASGEERYEQVFGDTFGLYTKKDMVEFIEPFKVRFERNNLDAKKIFSGKKCFDAGCGNGRGTLFMLMNGAEYVTSFDFSRKNTESTKRFVHEFGYKNCKVMEGTLEEIPFADETFDFVWCNGVIMHTKSPNKCLEEISRILKVNGQSWLYIYGSGGVYWRIIYHLREMLKGINVQECIATLKLFRYQTRYVAEFIDDWFASYLRTYTNEDLSKRLGELGFESPQVLKYGMDYDTSHRINTWASSKEKDLMGEGDLRYLLTKRTNERERNYLIPEGEYGSDYELKPIIMKEIDPLFETMKKKDYEDWKKIAIAAHIQRELRISLDRTEKLSIDEITDVISELIVQVENIKDI